MKENNARKFLKWIALHLYQFFKFYFVATSCLVGLYYCLGELPGVAKKIIEVSDRSLMVPFIWQLILLALFIFLFRTGSRWFFFYPARFIQKKMRLDLMRLMEITHPDQYKSYNQGQLYQYLATDCDQVRAFLGFAMLQIVNILISLAILIPKFLSLYPELFICLFPILAVCLLYTGITFFSHRFYKKTIETQAEVQQFIIQSYKAKRDIRTMQKEAIFEEKFLQRNSVEMYYFLLSSLMRSVARPLVALASSLSLVWGAYKLNYLYTVSDLVAFSTFVYLLLEPVLNLSWIGVVTSNGFASWKRIEDFKIDLQQKKNQSIQHHPSFVDVELRNFLPTHKRICIVGATGGGKSTFLFEIANFLKNEKKQLSYVYQEPYLFNDSAQNNITLDNETNFSEEELDKMLKLLSLEQLGTWSSFADLYVGEMGKKVSGGQRKRIALARSLYAQTDFLLWDDPMSSVDVIQEKKFWEEVTGFLKNKNLIYTSHRFTTVRQADLVISLLDFKIDRVLEPKKMTQEERNYLEKIFAAQIL
jgi:ATP-binding cassette subfamily B multidrug efflux pump